MRRRPDVRRVSPPTGPRPRLLFDTVAGSISGSFVTPIDTRHRYLLRLVPMKYGVIGHMVRNSILRAIGTERFHQQLGLRFIADATACGGSIAARRSLSGRPSIKGLWVKGQTQSEARRNLGRFSFFRVSRMTRIQHATTKCPTMHAKYAPTTQ